MDFDQRYKDGWVGGHQPRKNVPLSFSDAISSEQMHGFRLNLHEHIVVSRPRVDWFW